jgi:hypothetical protein
MKRQKTRATAAQFDQALLEQTKHVQGLNIPRNMISSAVMFAELVGRRLFGERLPKDRSPEFMKKIVEVMDDAKTEREQEAARAREQMKKVADVQPRIIIPGRGGAN